MKTTYTITAIAMFAVILGMSAIAPAMAEKPGEDGKHKTLLCHYQEAETITNEDGSTTDIPSEWALINVDNKGKMNGHFDKNEVTRHFENEPADGDFVINDNDEDDTNDLQDCLDLLPDEE